MQKGSDSTQSSAGVANWYLAHFHQRSTTCACLWHVSFLVLLCGGGCYVLWVPYTYIYLMPDSVGWRGHVTGEVMGDRRVDVVAPVGVISSDPSHFAHADRSPGRCASCRENFQVIPPDEATQSCQPAGWIFCVGREDDFQVQGRASDSDSVQWCRIEGIARARLLFRWIELLLDWIPNSSSD
jgi:hypothetical protein